jgi:hypothetical protein
MENTKILALANSDIKRADAYFRDYIEEDLIERYEVYYSDKNRYKRLFPKTARLNTMRTFDLWSTVEWLLPDLLQAFFGSDRIINISGVSGEDADKAEKIMKLIQWQLTVKNHGYKVFKGWFGDALATNMGVLKCYWKRETKKIPHLDVMDEQQLLGVLQNPNNEVISSKPIESIDSVLGLAPQTSEINWVENIITVNQPVIELVKPSDIRFVPDGRTLGECSMVAHRKLVTLDFLRREANRGVYDPAVVQEIIDTAHEYTDPTRLEITLNNAAREYGDAGNQERGRTRVVLYECYSKMDINDDGIMEDVILNVCEDKLLRVVENPWGRAPLFELIPFWDNYQVWSKVGLTEIVRDIQDTHTALLRQMIYGLGVSNQVHAVIDSTSINMQDLVDGSQFIRSKGPINPNAFQQLNLGGLNHQTFEMFEYIKTQLEQWTPVTRYNQGTDGESLNKTATGISMIMTASQRRQEEISRNFAETGIAELYRFLIKLNQKYIDQAQIIRLQNEAIPFEPMDLEGEFDLVVDASSGVGAKQGKTQALMQYLQQMFPMAMQMGVAGPEQFVIAGSKLLKLAGIEDAEKYLLQPVMPQIPMLMGPGAPGVPGMQSGSMPQALAMNMDPGAMGGGPNPVTERGPGNGNSLSENPIGRPGEVRFGGAKAFS